MEDRWIRNPEWAIWSAQIDGWGNFPVADYFKEKTGLSAYLFNDSNAAAWGEYCRGAGRGSQIFFYTNIGSGIGGGIILNGKLFDGQGYGAAEFGQSYLYDPWYKGDSRYPVNHIERICSGWSIEQRLRSDKIRSIPFYYSCVKDIRKKSIAICGRKPFG